MATVALVGAKGSLGHKLLPELVASDAIKKVHVLSRRTLPNSDPKVDNFKVDYSKPEQLVAALKGCDVLINAMGTEGNYEQSKHALVDAAAKAGVKFYIPRYHPVVDDSNHQVNSVSMYTSKAMQSTMHVGMEKSKMILMRGKRGFIVGLFMEHPQGGFQPGHGFMSEEEIWYLPGTGDVPLTFTSKKDIALSIIELIKIGMSDPSKLPDYVRLAGTNKTPKEIVEIFNRAAKGKTHIQLKLLSDEEGDAWMKNLKWDLPPGQSSDFDPEYMNEVASRVFRMSGGTGNIDFSKKNDNEVVNPGESKWKWKTIEEYAEEVDGMPKDIW